MLAGVALVVLTCRFAVKGGVPIVGTMDTVTVVLGGAISEDNVTVPAGAVTSETVIMALADPPWVMVAELGETDMEKSNWAWATLGSSVSMMITRSARTVLDARLLNEGFSNKPGAS